MKLLIYIIPLFFVFSLIGQELPEGIVIDLKEPTFHEGVIETVQGGVITGPNLRIQAELIRYIYPCSNGSKGTHIEAEGKLIVEYGEYIFVGDRLIYDLEKKEGTLFRARTENEPWYLGGEQIDFKADGSYRIQNAFITTSENIHPDWKVWMQSVEVSNDKSLFAEEIQLHILRYSIARLRYLKTNLNTIFDNPIKYRFKWGDVQGPRFGLTYELYFWERWRTDFRFDYRILRGPGGGFDSYYKSKDHKTEFQCTNYISCDSALSNIHENIRYRLEGRYSKLMNRDKVSILATYDKVSDIDLPSEYHDNDFEIETTERTQLLIRWQEKNWISKFYSRIRINNFQTAKQELPTYSVFFKPFSLGYSRVISENQAVASYLNFKYANNLAHVRNYDSTRLEYRPQLYRSFYIGPWHCTPEIGGVGIFYGNSPNQDSQMLALGQIGCRVNTSLFRFYGPVKHVIEPYTYYRYYSKPTSSPQNHYIFDINDGWYRLNQWTWGLRNTLYAKKGSGCVTELCSADLYTHLFIDTPTFKQAIPKVFGELSWEWTSNLFSSISTAWDLEEHQLDHFNFRSEWTLNADFAMAAEFRHRDSFSWRKADSTNFILDSYRSVERLRHSSVSDRRDTFLVHFFYRFHPKWSAEWVSRYGWNRRHQPNYFEYEINIFNTFQTGWNWRFSYQHLEGDNRVALYFNLGVKKPAIPCRCVD